MSLKALLGKEEFIRESKEGSRWRLQDILWLRREETYFQRKYLFIAKSSVVLFHKLALNFVYDTYDIQS